jgi:hypothetical protein
MEKSRIRDKHPGSATLPNPRPIALAQSCPPYTYDHEGKEGEADGDNDVLCHVALAEALLQHRLVPAAHESLLLLKGLSCETDLAFDDMHG